MIKDDVIIKKSKIHGKGAFASRDFRKGEVFIREVKVADYQEALFGYNFMSIRAPIGRERDKFEGYEVRERIKELYADCTDQAVLTTILRAGADSKHLHSQNIFSFIHFCLLFHPHLAFS